MPNNGRLIVAATGPVDTGGVSGGPILQRPGQDIVLVGGIASSRYDRPRFGQAVSLFILLAPSVCRSSRFAAINTPSALNQGPSPILSRASPPSPPPKSMVLK